MQRAFLLRAANYLLFLATCALIGTGLQLQYTFESGTPQRLLVAGLTKHEWGEWHFVIALLFIALCAFHLALNWSWIRKVATQQRRGLLIISVSLGLLLIALPFLLPHTQRAPGDGAGREGSG